MLKYFELKKSIFLLVGITWIGLSEPWWPSSISFIVAAISGEGLSPEMYFLIGNILIPLFVMTWITAFANLLYPTKRLLLQILTAIHGIGFLIIFFSALLTDPSQIGTLEGAVDVEYLSLVRIYLLSVLVILIVTGVLFARQSIKVDDSEVKLKGKFLLFAFIFFVAGAAFDSAVVLNAITLPIVRIILIASALCFYGGFILPDWMKKLFLK